MRCNLYALLIIAVSSLIGAATLRGDDPTSKFVLLAPISSTLAAGRPRGVRKLIEGRVQRFGRPRREDAQGLCSKVEQCIFVERVRQRVDCDSFFWY